MSMIRKYADFVLSILFITSAILGYYKDISHMSEYCFISGMLVGIIFFVSFLRHRKYDRALPACVYLACFIDIFVIFIATVAIRLNLEGAFWFIHIINPIAITLYWFIFCDQRSMKWQGTFSVIVYPLLYMLFACILFKISGKCPFPASLIYMDYSGITPLIIIIVLMTILWAMGYILHMLNKLIRKQVKKQKKDDCRD